MFKEEIKELKTGDELNINIITLDVSEMKKICASKVYIFYNESL